MTLRSAILAAVTGETAQETDPYYNLVSLHLKGDVNTGRTYNAFSDASSNNFRLTNSGDVRGSSFSPYGTSWSGFFDGSSTLSIPASAANDFGSSDFTVEFFWYVTNTSARQWVFHAATDWWLGIDYNYSGAGANKLSIYASSNGTSWDIFNGDIPSANGVSTGVPTPNIWNHIALCRVGSAWGLFLNGVRVWTGSSSASIVSRSGQVKYIGSWAGGSTYRIYGYLSNFRQVVGKSVYNPSDATLIVPTSQLTSSGTNFTGQAYTATLLICHTNRFIDRDGAAGTLTVTRNGDTRISSFSPFLDSDTTSGSGYFDGTGDYLNYTQPGGIGNGDFTLEFWLYPFQIGDAPRNVWECRSAESATDGFWLGSDTINFYMYLANSKVISTSYPIVNAWTHVALVRSGNDHKLYFNGTQVGSTYTAANNYSNTSIFISRYVGSATYYTNGYVSSLRLVKGVAVYTGNFTPPAAPLAATQSAGTNIQAITGTQTALLTLQERGAYNTVGFQDESEYQHVITRPSGANVAQGTFSPFSNSGWSNYFNGSSSFNPGSLGTSIGTSDFSLEFFIYQTASAGIITPLALLMDDGNAIYLQTNSGSARFLSNSGISAISGGTVNINTWNHLLATRQGSTVRLFVNGVLVASTTSSTSFTTPTTSYIGGATTLYLTSVRVCIGSVPTSYQTSSTTNGSSIFTSPTSLLTTSSQGATAANVKLLTCQSNRFVDISDSPKTLTISGSPSVQAFSPFAPVAYDPQVHGGSAYFDRTGDFLSLATNNNFDFGTGNFTVELFYYPLAYDDIQMFFSGTSNYQFGYSASDSRNLYYYGSNSGNVISGTPASSMVLNQWNHIVLVRSGTSLAIMSNGVRQGTATHSSTVNFSGSPVVGSYADNTAFYAIRGYMSGFRAVKGVAVYDPTQTTYTVPSGPLPLLGNTSLLLNFINAGVIDSTGKNVIETVGNSGVVTTLKKYGSGSMFFDGTSDQQKITPKSQVVLGNSDWTVEFWAYTSATPAGGYCGRFIYPSTGFFIRNTSGTVIDAGHTGSGVPITTASGVVVTNTWQHIALAKSGTTANLYVNGVCRATGSWTWNEDLTEHFYIGSTYVGQEYFNGYIDDFRVTRGLARYTGSTVGTTYFTPPTKALPDRGTLSTLTSDLAAPSSVEALVVAGGAAGGLDRGGGGGAGGFREFVGGNAIAVSAGTNYPLTIGAGGPVNGTVGDGNDGNISRFGSVYSSAGGGGGGAGRGGRNGGSGGGSAVSTIAAGLGNSGSYSPVEGYGGGLGNAPPNPGDAGGGGGGAGGAGSVGGSTGGAGGIGAQSSITGVPTYYAGGGGGGKNGGTGGAGGQGGGGAAQNSTSGSGTAGTANTGGGGGAGSGQTGTANGVPAAGGSGVVILAYPTSFRPLKASLGLVYTIDTVTRPGYRVYKFTAGTGSISW